MPLPFEPDTPPPLNTFRRYLWNLVQGLPILGGYWGRRFVGTLGLMADTLADATNQAFYARLPGHPEQAPDSLTQVGKDRDLYQFRGETQVNWAARVRNAWADYAQGGTSIQLLNVLNQWGNAGWPSTWGGLTSANLVESSHTSFTFTITIPYGYIEPPWTPVTYGSGYVYGSSDLYYGIGPSTDIPTLLYLVKKWKPSRSKGFIVVYYSSTGSVTFTV